MIGLQGTVSGLDGVNRLLESVQPKAIDAVERGVRRGVLGGQSIVRGNARGRPGPRVGKTGDFNRSIVGEAERSGVTVWGQIGSNADQALRLEFGFMNMTDVLGRTFRQPAYPYLAPSVDAVDKLVRDMVAAEVTKEF